MSAPIVRLSKNARLRASSAVTAAAALLALACGGRPASRPPETPSPNVSASAVAPTPPSGAASSSASASASASAAAPQPPTTALAPKPIQPQQQTQIPKSPPPAVAKAPDPPPRGKPGGRIAPEIIQRVVRANFDRFRLCYENNLRNCPNLQGRVAVRFVIDIDGSVKKPRPESSDLADPIVSACVAERFREIQFPPPEGGTVTVVYPITFSPGG